ncbi:MAG TPA: helix-turn-helix domain-containing protein [bacterium]|nr:helix-turn-helix domain-containing protein [bacterium]
MNKLYKINIGKKIKEIAELKNFSVKVLSQKLNLTQQAVYDLYNKESPKTDILIEVANALNVPISIFFDDIIPKDLPNDIYIDKPPECPRCKDKDKIISLLEENLKLLREKYEPVPEPEIKINKKVKRSDEQDLKKTQL